MTMILSCRPTSLGLICAKCGTVGCRMKGAAPAVIQGYDDVEIGLEYLADFDFICEWCIESEVVDID